MAFSAELLLMLRRPSSAVVAEFATTELRGNSHSRKALLMCVFGGLHRAAQFVGSGPEGLFKILVFWGGGGFFFSGGLAGHKGNSLYSTGNAVEPMPLTSLQWGWCLFCPNRRGLSRCLWIRQQRSGGIFGKAFSNAETQTRHHGIKRLIGEFSL